MGGVLLVICISCDLSHVFKLEIRCILLLGKVLLGHVLDNISKKKTCIAMVNLWKLNS